MVVASVKLNEFDAKEYSSKLLKLEEQLRLKESEATGVTPEGIDKTVYELSKQGFYRKEAIDGLSDKLSRAGDLAWELREIPNISDAAYALNSWAYNLYSDINTLCTEQRIPGVGMMYRCPNFPGDKYYERQKEVSNYVGRCGFIQEGETEISPIRAIDSFTNCMHSFALKLSEGIRSEELEGTLCVGESKPEFKGRVAAFCREFTQAVEDNEDGYIGGDQGAQEATISNGRIDVEVGGAVGHRTKIYLDRNEVEYEDHAWKRAQLFKRIMERMDFECKGEYTIRCKGELDESKLKKVARLLSAMPSLDIHIDEFKNRRIDNLVDELWDDAVDVWSDQIYETAREMAEDRVEEDVEEALSCAEEKIEEYVERREPKYGDIVEYCFD